MVTRPTVGYGGRSTSLWVHWNLFGQLSRDGNLHGSDISHATTASPKPSFRAPLRMGDAVVSRKCWMDNIKVWTSLPMPELLTRAFCRKDWKKISAESSLMSPRWPSWSRNWTELNWRLATWARIWLFIWWFLKDIITSYFPVCSFFFSCWLAK